MMKEQLIREIEEIRKAQSDLRLRLNAVEDQVGRLPSQQLNPNEKPSFKISEKEPLKLFSFIKKLVLLELPAVQETAREKDQSLEPPALREIPKVNVPTAILGSAIANLGSVFTNLGSVFKFQICQYQLELIKFGVSVQISNMSVSVRVNEVQD